MTIYEIKQRTCNTNPHFFDRKTMQFFGQRLRDYRIKRQSDGRYLITCPFGSGKPQGKTVRYFNPLNNELERI